MPWKFFWDVGGNLTTWGRGEDISLCDHNDSAKEKLLGGER